MGKILYHSFQEINEALKKNPSNDDMVRYLYSDIKGDDNFLIIEYLDREMLDRMWVALIYNVIEAMIKIEDMLLLTPQDRGLGRTRIGFNLYFSANREDIRALKISLLGEKAKKTGDLKRKGDRDIKRQIAEIERKRITCFLSQEILDKFLRKLNIFESKGDENNGR